MSRPELSNSLHTQRYSYTLIINLKKMLPTFTWLTEEMVIFLKHILLNTFILSVLGRGRVYAKMSLYFFLLCPLITVLHYASHLLSLTSFIARSSNSASAELQAKRDCHKVKAASDPEAGLRWSSGSHTHMQTWTQTNMCTLVTVINVSECVLVWVCDASCQKGDH